MVNNMMRKGKIGDEGIVIGWTLPYKGRANASLLLRDGEGNLLMLERPWKEVADEAWKYRGCKVIVVEDGQTWKLRHNMRQA